VKTRLLTGRTIPSLLSLFLTGIHGSTKVAVSHARFPIISDIRYKLPPRSQLRAQWVAATPDQGHDQAEREHRQTRRRLNRGPGLNVYTNHSEDSNAYIERRSGMREPASGPISPRPPSPRLRPPAQNRSPPCATTTGPDLRPPAQIRSPRTGAPPCATTTGPDLRPRAQIRPPRTGAPPCATTTGPEAERADRARSSANRDREPR